MSQLIDTMRMLVKAALAEDVGRGDLTTLACLEPDKLKAEVVAKSSGLLSGLKPFQMTFETVDSANDIFLSKKDGDSFEAGETILTIDGFNQTVLVSERVALNFLGRLSGIATMTDQFVKAMNNSAVKLIDTRKTTPGWRLLEKEAVIHGGGENHRLGLYDMVLIKDNHIASAGSITSAIKRTQEFLDSADYRLQFEIEAETILIEVEVVNEIQLTEAIEAGADRLLLDNQTFTSLTNLTRLARKLNPAVKLEASGNITLDTIADFAATGVDYISVGAITHSAPSSDFSLRVIS